jgi:hypothetical protein
MDEENQTTTTATPHLDGVPPESLDIIYAHCVPRVPLDTRLFGRSGPYDGLILTSKHHSSLWKDRKFMNTTFWLDARAFAAQPDGSIPAIDGWFAWLRSLSDRQTSLLRTFYIVTDYYRAVLKVRLFYGRISVVECSIRLEGQKLSVSKPQSMTMEMEIQMMMGDGYEDEDEDGDGNENENEDGKGAADGDPNFHRQHFIICRKLKVKDVEYITKKMLGMSAALCEIRNAGSSGNFTSAGLRAHWTGGFDGVCHCKNLAKYVR